MSPLSNFDISPLDPDSPSTPSFPSQLRRALVARWTFAQIASWGAPTGDVLLGNRGFPLEYHRSRYSQILSTGSPPLTIPFTGAPSNHEILSAVSSTGSAIFPTPNTGRSSSTLILHLSLKKAAMLKDKPFAYYRELCTIFSKDWATGRYAESTTDDVEEMDREPQPTPMEEVDFGVLGEGIEAMDFISSHKGTNVENASDAGSSKKKRKKKGLGVVDQTIYEIAERSIVAMTASMKKNVGLISKALQDGEVQEMRKKLNFELANVAGLTRAERHRALSKLRVITQLQRYSSLLRRMKRRSG